MWAFVVFQLGHVAAEDFFSIPQERNDPQQKAIESIASYVAKCTFFFVLQPVVESPESGEVFGPSTWASRGWCRLEKTIRELQPKHSYVVIKSDDHLEAMTQAAMSRTIGGPPGEGHFTFERDRKKLAAVLAAYMSDLIFAYLERGDILAYRAYLNLQPVFLGGFSLQSEGMAPMFCPIPGFESDADGAKPALKMSTTSAEFLHHNGFKKVNEHDKCGWSPLLYAVLRGDPLIVRSLLEDRADPNGQTRKPNPILGVPSGLSTSLVCTYFRGDKECLQELISARADLEAGWIPPMCGSALGNHPDCIRLLCEAGDTPHRASFVNITVIMNAAYTNALEAAKELLAQSDGTISLSRALGFALYYRGDAEMVQLLLDAKADMNEKMTMPLSTPYGLGWTILGIQRRFGAGRRGAHVGYHAFGSTPLMFAILTGQHEGAAVLLAAKAKVDVQKFERVDCLRLGQRAWGPTILDRCYRRRSDDLQQDCNISLDQQISCLPYFLSAIDPDGPGANWV